MRIFIGESEDISVAEKVMVFEIKVGGVREVMIVMGNFNEKKVLVRET